MNEYEEIARVIVTIALGILVIAVVAMFVLYTLLGPMYG